MDRTRHAISNTLRKDLDRCSPNVKPAGFVEQELSSLGNIQGA